jgi:hypothetical protein
LERAWFNPDEFSGEKRTIRQFAGWAGEKKPPLFGKAKEGSAESSTREPNSDSWHKFGMGKTESERIIYWTSIAVWLVPIVMATIKWRV